jgi:serine protease Do
MVLAANCNVSNKIGLGVVIMRRLLVLFMMLFAAYPAEAQKRPLGYAAAASQFEALAVEQRIRLQVLLTASGYWPAVPNVNFNGRLFEAIANFQRENNYYPNGQIDQMQFRHLADAAAPLLNLWGFRSVSHPFRSARLWIPFGLGLRPERSKEGWVYKEPTNRVQIGFIHFAQTRVDQGFDALVRRKIADGATIHYKILKDDFLVISASTADGTDQYIRFHNDGSGSTGFMLMWASKAARDMHIERVATLMSASLWADRTGAAFIDPPGQEAGSSVARAPYEPPPAPTPVPTPSPNANAASLDASTAPERSKPDDDEEGPTSGTGFFVSKEGHLLTNAHVVEACTKGILVTTEGQQPTFAYLMKVDKTNDLALLKTTVAPSRVASFRTGVRLGEGIAVFGYPFAGVLSTSGNFTLGNVTALSGLGDDSRHLQISAPVQAGNSGGPLLDENGNMVGVVVSKLNALKVMVATKGEIPQNVNFAIKASVASAFLESNGISPATGTVGETKVNPADLADQAKAMSAYIVCDK